MSQVQKISTPPYCILLILVPVGLMAAASATSAAVRRKTFGLDITVLIISNREMEAIMKIIKSLEVTDLLTKYVGKIIKNEAKEQKCWFLWMFLDRLVASILSNMLAGKPKIPGWGVITACKGVIGVSEETIKAGQDF